MPHEHERPEVTAAKEVPTYEEGVNISAIFKFLMILTLVAIAVQILIWLFFQFLNQRETNLDPRTSPLSVQRQFPPAPTLQVSPPQDLQRFRQKEDATLKEYGWVDRQKGTVRIPIQEAMKSIIMKNSQQTGKK